MFWPKQIWSKYADKLEDFKEPKNADKAVQCLNELVTDALRYVLTWDTVHWTRNSQYLNASGPWSFESILLDGFLLCETNIQCMEGILLPGILFA